MSAIPLNFGSGGANLAPNGQAGSPDLATALREIADDLAGVKPPAIAAAAVGAVAAMTAANPAAATAVAPAGATVGGDIAAFTDPPSAAEMALLRTFVNALKADYAAGRAELVKLVADYAAGRAEIVKLVTDATAHGTRLGELRTLANEVRTDLNTSNGYVVKTTKA